MSEERMVQLNIRVTRSFKEMIQRFVQMDSHKDISEFTREALREKIQRDAPNLYRNQFDKSGGSH
jgi:Arc/MetJ-type ribon-helix-helix transcriptional regulator